VVAIRHDALSGFKSWMHSGSREVLDLVRARESEWRWWDNPQIRRPLVSIVPVKPTDEFEAARPEVGVMLRIRCAWQNTPQGLAKNPITELVKLTVDGKEVSLTLVQKKQGANFADYFHQFHLTNPAPGQHTTSALVRVLATNETSSRNIEFTV
jgi:hypothetical protein